MARFQPLTASAQTAYAQLLDAAVAHLAVVDRTALVNAFLGARHGLASMYAPITSAATAGTIALP